MALVLGSVGLDDDAFLWMVRESTLALSQLRHANHLRLAWLYVHRTSLEQAELAVQNEIKRFAASHNIPEIYNETMTMGWVRLIATHREKSFEEFAQANESRLKPNVLHRFWTPELLASKEAKMRWVAPDLQDLPG